MCVFLWLYFEVGRLMAERGSFFREWLPVKNPVSDPARPTAYTLVSTATATPVNTGSHPVRSGCSVPATADLERRAENGERRVESGEPRAEIREPRAEHRAPSAGSGQTEDLRWKQSATGWRRCRFPERTTRRLFSWSRWMASNGGGAGTPSTPAQLMLLLLLLRLQNIQLILPTQRYRRVPAGCPSTLLCRRLGCTSGSETAPPPASSPSTWHREGLFLVLPLPFVAKPPPFLAPLRYPDKSAPSLGYGMLTTVGCRNTLMLAHDHDCTEHPCC